MQESASADQMPSRLELSGTHRIVAGLVLFLVVIMTLGIILHDYLFIALNAACVFLLTIPWWGQKRVDWFSMWSILTLSTVGTLLLRSIYITFDIPSSYDIENMFLLGRSKDFLLRVMPVMLAGLAVLTAGYLMGPRASLSISLRVFRSDRWNEKRLLLLVCIMLVLSVLALGLFIQRTGGLDLQRISAKRTAARGLELEDYQAYGYLRWTTGLSTLAAMLLLTKIISKDPMWRRYLLLLIPALAVSVFFDVYASSRAGVAFLFVQALALAYYMAGRRLNLRNLVVLGIIALLGFSVLTQLRREGDLGQLLLSGHNLLQWLDPFLVAQQFVDVSKTAHMLDAIPEVLDFQWGRTLVLWAVAWIPRSLWSAKPVISLGQMVGVLVLNSADKLGGGVSPGLFAELYWNFSFPGIVVGSFAAGYLIRFVQVNFDAYAQNRNVVLLYVTSFMMVGMTLVGGSVSFNIIEILKTAVPLYAILLFLTERSPVGGSSEAGNGP